MTFTTSVILFFIMIYWEKQYICQHSIISSNITGWLFLIAYIFEFYEKKNCDILLRAQKRHLKGFNFWIWVSKTSTNKIAWDKNACDRIYFIIKTTVEWYLIGSCLIHLIDRCEW